MDAYQEITSQVRRASYLGIHDVEGTPSHHLYLVGDDVDVYKLPSPKFYEKDGGRFIGTACFMVVQDPETGEPALVRQKPPPGRRKVALLHPRARQRPLSI